MSNIETEGFKEQDEDEKKSKEITGNEDEMEMIAKDTPLDKNLYLIRGTSSFISVWEKLIIVLAIYNSFMIPLQLFFGEYGLEAFSGSTVSAVDAIIDLVFIIDIIINFRTTFLDTNLSEEVTNSYKIARQYISSGAFFIDFISSVPFESFFNFDTDSDSAFKTFIELLGLLKLLRIARLSTTVRKLNLAQEYKVYLKILMMILLILVVIHVLSCIWLYTVMTNQRWVQNMDFMYYGMDDAYQSFFEGDEAFYRRYAVLLYTGFYLFGVGEVVPRSTQGEFGIAFLLLASCTIINAVVIGYMTTYVDELNRKSQELADRINLTNTAMLNL